MDEKCLEAFENLEGNFYGIINSLRRQLAEATHIIIECRGHAGAAIVQSLPSDDPIIMEHFRAIEELTRYRPRDSNIALDTVPLPWDEMPEWMEAQYEK
jgi:hypothetical protein